MQKGAFMKVFTNSSSINDLIVNSMDKLKGLIDSSTIVGESISSADGTTIIPISKVTVGFVVGGGEYADISGVLHCSIKAAAAESKHCIPPVRGREEKEGSW